MVQTNRQLNKEDLAYGESIYWIEQCMMPESISSQAFGYLSSLWAFLQFVFAMSALCVPYFGFNEGCSLHGAPGMKGVLNSPKLSMKPDNG